jgi:hypothetical protein
MKVMRGQRSKLQMAIKQKIDLNQVDLSML